MITQVTTITTPEIRRRKTVLESKLKELLGVSSEREELRIEHLADPIDQVRSSADRDLVIQRIDHQARQIQDIQSALAKIEGGIYVVCERCEEPIPRKRLDAVSWARLCAACQSEEEATRHGGKTTFQNAAEGSGLRSSSIRVKASNVAVCHIVGWIRAENVSCKNPGSGRRSVSCASKRNRSDCSGNPWPARI